ncbi:MAG: L,D-transpeptidase [Bacillota bacterium]|nr:L,D-transpeptidase [Bacillota bacterium]
MIKKKSLLAIILVVCMVFTLVIQNSSQKVQASQLTKDAYSSDGVNISNSNGSSSITSNGNAINNKSTTSVSKSSSTKPRYKSQKKSNVGTYKNARDENIVKTNGKSAVTARAPDSSLNKAASNSSAVKTSDYYVYVSIGNQTVDVYKEDSLIKSMVCSTGTDDAPTPTGKFYIGNKGKSFFSTKYEEGGYNWVSFLGNYLFHSVPFDSSGNVIPTEAGKLGTKASHGCVRLSLEDSKWFYDNIPANTLVTISQ